MINTIIFDFDGVLASLKEVHYLSLNKALELIDQKFIISEEEHNLIYDGLSTKKKLDLLEINKGLPKDRKQEIFNNKQNFTIQCIEDCLSFNQNLFDLLKKLKSENYKLYIASNAIRQTIILGLTKLGILDLFDRIYSNEDVSCQKPNPQIYLKCIVDACVLPKETLIVEDSKHGRESAMLSGAYVCGVDNPNDLTYEKLYNIINIANSKSNKVKWAGKDINILIPMAGAGSRFQKAGYKLPKPLINVFNKPMIQQVVDNLNIDGNFIFVVQKEHYEQYNLDILLPLVAPGCKIVQTNGLTEGAACTTLLAKEFINNDQHLFIANSDQFVEWNSCDFMYYMISNNLDGGLLTFNDTNPKWSFSKIDKNGFVIEVAEKNPISDIATVGLYYFKRGSDYVKYSEQMISKNIRTNNEFYICPVYNQFIEDNKKIKNYMCDKMWGMGTPEDLEYFLQNYKQ